MDTLDFRRRKVAASGEIQDVESGGQPKELETALSQPFGIGPEGSSFTAGMRASQSFGSRNPLEASPGMIERGQGPSNLTASPFHSERVKTEVEIRRHRPLTLDADARKAARLPEDPAEHVYGHPGLMGEGARVARVEAREGEQDRGSDREPSPRCPQSLGPPMLEAMESTPAEVGVTRVNQAECEEEGPRTPTRGGESSLALVAMEQAENRPCPRDSRELVPAGQSDLAELMRRLVEENHSLRQRLDQMEAGTARTPSVGSGLEVSLHSPVSFGPKEVRGPDVQVSDVRAASEGLLSRSFWPQYILNSRVSGNQDRGSSIDDGGQPLWEPSMLTVSGPQHFWIGSGLERTSDFPPVPRLPLLDLREGLVEDRYPWENIGGVWPIYGSPTGVGGKRIGGVSAGCSSSNS